MKATPLWAFYQMPLMPSRHFHQTFPATEFVQVRLLGLRNYAAASRVWKSPRQANHSLHGGLIRTDRPMITCYS